MWNSGWPNKQLQANIRTKSVKKTSAKEVYDAIAAEMKEARKAEPFQSRNAACRKNKGDLAPLDVDHKWIQTKYKNLKQQWRQISDSKKNGSGLAGRDDPEWFIIITPVLSDTNGGFNPVCSGPLHTSLVDTNMD